MQAAPEEIGTALARLTDRLAGMSHAWYQGHTQGGDGVVRPRSEHLRALVLELAELGREAGSGVPAGVVPHALRAHALADQITVLTADIVAAGPSPSTRTRTVAALRAGYDTLWFDGWA
ncbi:MAG TPA: hypothetical protein VHC41_11170 [Mycobacteriales bacterium]|jgi:hypothetical protein|nr:hypothetical protein [Mycobacteriales bacterium]